MTSDSAVNDRQLDDAQSKLDAFLVENQELETLNARLSAFNLFDVLRIENVEIRHSNVLAWLLTPEASHGFGPIVLRRFLSRLLLENDLSNISLRPSQVELMDFGDVEVFREWKHIDILARSRRNKWCLLIENKVTSKEARGQLNRYIAIAQQEMPEFQIIPVYLTLEGDDPSEDCIGAGYTSLSYAQILDLLEQVSSQHRSRLAPDVETFLGHYLKTIRRLTMQDEALIELCKTIYRKHRDAINLIVEYGMFSDVREAIINELDRLVECEYVRPTRGGVWFLPKDIGRLIPSQTMSGWGFLPRSVPIAFWYYYQRKREKLILILEVGPLADGAKRIELLNAIHAAGLKVREAGFREEAKFTRLVSLSQKPKKSPEGEPDLSEESIVALVRSLWSKMVEELPKLKSILEEFDWES